MNQNTPAPATERRKIALQTYTALSMLRNGTAGKQEWQDCADALNVTEELGRMGKIKPLDILDRAQAHMVLAMDNFIATGRMTMQAEGIRLMQQIVGEHDRALQRFSRSTMAQAAANFCIRAAAARERGVKVVE